MLVMANGSVLGDSAQPDSSMGRGEGLSVILGMKTRDMKTLSINVQMVVWIGGQLALKVSWILSNWSQYKPWVRLLWKLYLLISNYSFTLSLLSCITEPCRVQDNDICEACRGYETIQSRHFWHVECEAEYKGRYEDIYCHLGKFRRDSSVTAAQINRPCGKF